MPYERPLPEGRRRGGRPCAMTEVVLLSCSKSKRHDGSPGRSDDSFLGNPGPDTIVAQLLAARAELFPLIVPCQDRTCSAIKDDALLEAHKRYNGIVFSMSCISTGLPPESALRVLIVSALFGLLDARDSIPDYDLELACSLSPGGTVGQFWRRRELGSITAAVVRDLNPTAVHDL